MKCSQSSREQFQVLYNSCDDKVLKIACKSHFDQNLQYFASLILFVKR